MSGGRRTRLGVIGAGRWGRNIIRTLREMPAAEVAWVASGNPATRELTGAHCIIDPDWRALLRQGGIDGAVVATPPALHAEMTAAAVSSGLPVFVEKPLTCDVAQAEALLDLARANAGYVLVDHVHLFSHAYRELKRRLPDVGPVRRIDADAGAWGPFRPDVPVLWDWGAHDAAFCVDLLPSCPETVAVERTERKRIETGWGETLAVRAEYADDVVATVRLSNLLTAKRRRLTVEGRHGTLVYDDAAVWKFSYAPAGCAGTQGVETPYAPPLTCALAQFLDNVAGGRGDLGDLRFGVDVVRLLAVWAASLG